MRVVDYRRLGHGPFELRLFQGFLPSFTPWKWLFYDSRSETYPPFYTPHLTPDASHLHLTHHHLAVCATAFPHACPPCSLPTTPLACTPQA